VGRHGRNRVQKHCCEDLLRRTQGFGSVVGFSLCGGGTRRWSVSIVMFRIEKKYSTYV